MHLIGKLLLFGGGCLVQKALVEWSVVEEDRALANEREEFAQCFG